MYKGDKTPNGDMGKSFGSFSGYLLEPSLSVDNLFVFVLIFKYFKVPLQYQSRVLSYGIAGAVVFHASLILLGTATLHRFEAVNLLLASILFYSSYKLFAEEGEESDLSANFVVKTCQKFIPLTPAYNGDKFLTTRDGMLKAIPLLLTVAVIELSDIAFAVDSIPAVFGVIRDPFIVFSSNLFAIIGLRSLYILINNSMLELEARLLTGLCLYNYTLGRDIKHVINITEGLRESLRQLSSITWMAKELLQVADRVHPRKSHISCVRTQILEAGHSGNGAATLIDFRGQLYSWYSAGSIKIWDFQDQSAKLVRDIKAHRKKITCFALFDPGDYLVTGSAATTIKIWKMVQRQLEPLDTVEMKESVLKMKTHGQQIYAFIFLHLMFHNTGSEVVKMTDDTITILGTPIEPALSELGLKYGGDCGILHMDCGTLFICYGRRYSIADLLGYTKDANIEVILHANVQGGSVWLP